MRIREVRGGIGYRIYQVRKPKNRHVVDVRSASDLPPTQRVDDVSVLAPAESIASKVIGFVDRKGKPKAGTDWRDLAMLMLTFPELKTDDGPVHDRLEAAISEGAAPTVLETWKDLVAREILPEDEDDKFQ